jgi:hypothetical protein
MKVFTIALVTMTAALALSAQGTGHDPFVGTWKLDAPKSKYDPGPGMRSETVAVAADGKVTVRVYKPMATMSTGLTPIPRARRRP